MSEYRYNGDLSVTYISAIAKQPEEIPKQRVPSV